MGAKDLHPFVRYVHPLRWGVLPAAGHQCICLEHQAAVEWFGHDRASWRVYDSTAVDPLNRARDGAKPVRFK